ncbi:MAG: zinc ribbon domain-containing protein [Tepidiformaceae bacterium]
MSLSQGFRIPRVSSQSAGGRYIRVLDEPIPGYFSAIIPSALYLKVRQVRKERRVPAGPRTSTNLFQGLLVCGHCGGPMHLKNHGKRKQKYPARRKFSGSWPSDCQCLRTMKQPKRTPTARKGRMTTEPTIDTDAFKKLEREGYSRVARGYDEAIAGMTSQINDAILDGGRRTTRCLLAGTARVARVGSAVVRRGAGGNSPNAGSGGRGLTERSEALEWEMR